MSGGYWLCCSATTMVVLPPKTRARDAKSSTESSTAVALFKLISPTSINFTALVETLRSDSDHNLGKGGAVSRRSASNGKRRPRRMRRFEADLPSAGMRRFKPSSPSATPPSDQADAALARGAGRPSNDGRRKAGPQPLPPDRDLADRGAYRRPKRPAGIRRNARHGQGRHRRDPARRTFPGLSRRAGEKGAASGALAELFALKSHAVFAPIVLMMGSESQGAHP